MDDIALNQPAGRIELNSTCKNMFYINFKLPTQQVVFFAQDLFLILTHYQLTTLCKWTMYYFFLCIILQMLHVNLKKEKERRNQTALLLVQCLMILPRELTTLAVVSLFVNF